MTRWLRREGWVAGLFVIFAALLVATRLIQPGYGGGDFGSLARAVLPYAFAVAAQTVVVIAGGIDLSVASMMALTSVTAARAMQGASDETAALVVVLVLLMGLALGALNGILIVVTRVPDIVVTLAMLFVLQGAALLVLEAPGGAAADWLRQLIVGTVSIPGVPDAVEAWIPKALVLLLVCLAVGLDPAPPLAARPLDLRHRLERARRLPQRRPGRPHPDRRLRHRRAVRRDGRPVADHVDRHRRADPRPLPARQRRGRGARRRRARRRPRRARRPDRRRLHPAPRPDRPDAALRSIPTSPASSRARSWSSW